MKINVDEWKIFKLGKIFRIENVKGNTTSDLKTGVEIPYIAAQKNRNGLSQMCSSEDMSEFISEGNCIVFIQIGEGSAGFSNYIPNDFIGMRGKISCGYIDGILNRKIGLFLVTILDKSRYKFSFGRSWTGERLKNSELLLPIKTNENGSAIIDTKKTFSDEGYIPDWKYMEDFIENLEDRDRDSYGSIKDFLKTGNNSDKTPDLNISYWKEFKIGNLFNLYNGKGITQKEVNENPGTLNVVQSGEENNGLIGCIDLNYVKEMNYTYSLNPCLTVARTGSAGYVSFQSRGCVVGDSAKILILKKDDPLNVYYLFIQAVMSKLRYKYSYGRKVTEDKYLNEIIKLPIQKDKDNSPIIDETKKYSAKGYIPDWDFMESYISSLPYGDKI